MPGPLGSRRCSRARTPTKVGPIRSARTQDVDLVGSFNGAVFACSGGNKGAIAAIRSLGPAGAHRGPGPRLVSRQEPPSTARHVQRHGVAALQRGPGPPGPAQQFHYRDGRRRDATALRREGFKLHIEQVHAEWHFDAEPNSYERSQEGKPHLLADGTQVAFNNVIVLWIDYGHSPADVRSPDGGTIGNGDAVVFTNGKMINATWSRDDRLDPIAAHRRTGSIRCC